MMRSKDLTAMLNEFDNAIGDNMFMALDVTIIGSFQTKMDLKLEIIDIYMTTVKDDTIYEVRLASTIPDAISDIAFERKDIKDIEYGIESMVLKIAGGYILEFVM